MRIFGIIVLALTFIFTVWELMIGLFNIIWGKYDLNVTAQKRGWHSLVTGLVSAVLFLVEHLIFI